MKVAPVAFTKAKLAELWANIPTKKKEQCIEKYGSLHVLIDFEVNWNLIKALMWFWDPSRRCFVINGQDCTPTIEEYQAIMRCTSGKGDNMNHFKVYQPEPKIKPWRKLAHVFDVEVPKPPGTEEFQGISLDQLIHIRNQAIEKKKLNKLKSNAPKKEHHEDEDDVKIHAFLFAIYGTLIFPSRKDVIDQGIFEFMAKFIKFGINPIISILAETFATLNKLVQEKHGRFTACAHLLPVWAYCRFAYCQPECNYFTISARIQEARSLLIFMSLPKTLKFGKTISKRQNSSIG